MLRFSSARTGTFRLPEPRRPGFRHDFGSRNRIDKTVPVVFSTDDTFDVGADWGTPVSPTYRTPFTFTGNLNQVTIETK